MCFLTFCIAWGWEASRVFVLDTDSVCRNGELQSSFKSALILWTAEGLDIIFPRQSAASLLRLEKPLVPGESTHFATDSSNRPIETWISTWTKSATCQKFLSRIAVPPFLSMHYFLVRPAKPCQKPAKVVNLSWESFCSEDMLLVVVLCSCCCCCFFFWCNSCFDTRFLIFWRFRCWQCSIHTSGRF